MADTVDEISGGRLIVGIGAGYHAPEYRAFGYPHDHRVGRLAEALAILHGLLRDGHVDLNGTYHQARDRVLRPRGPRPAGPPIMIGSIRPRMLGLTARYADSWNTYYDDTKNRVDQVSHLQTVVDDACREAGRDPRTLARTVTVLVADASAEPWWERLPTGQETTAIVPLRGSPQEIAAGLRAVHDAGIGHIQICLEPTTAASIAAFAPVLDALRGG